MIYSRSPGQKAIDAHARDSRETEAALTSRDSSTEIFDSSDFQTVAIILALMNMAGMEGESERFEPTLRTSRSSSAETSPEQVVEGASIPTETSAPSEGKTQSS